MLRSGIKAARHVHPAVSSFASQTTTDRAGVGPRDQTCGYRLLVRRNGDGVRLYTRRGFDWSKRFPLIVEAAARLRVHSAMIDGEAIVCGQDGRSDFDKLHGGGYDEQVVLFAFDLLAVDGEDLRRTAAGTKGNARLRLGQSWYWP